MKQPRSIVIAIIGIMLLSVCPFLGQALGTKARIEERGKLWVVYKGQPDGVSVGMEGYLMKKTYSSQARKLVEKKIAHFRVSKVFRINSHALVDKWMENYSSKDAQWAQFTQRLVPPRGVKPKSKSKSVKKVETGKDKRWYLDKGDNAYELGKYELAMSYYDRVIEIDPDDPGAKLRTRAAQGKSFIQQGNLDYEKKDYSRAYEYYINAYQQIPGEDKFLSAERIVDLWGIEDGFFEKMKDYEISPTVILGDLFTYCDQLLKENRLDKLTVLAKKLVRYAEDDARRNKLATLMMAKEIQGDIDGGNYFKLLELTELSIAETNIYKADYILDKLDKSSMDGTTREKVALLKEKLDSKKTEMQIGKVIREKADKIKKLGKQAKSFEAIKNYDEAINRYLEMYKLEPDNSEYSSKIKKLQLDKFNYEKFQKQIKARVEMDDLMLHAEDSVANDLMQDALDYYVKAYKKLPEEGKPIAGVIKVLEECGADDAKYITIALLGRKSSKFTKDFLRLVEKNYLNTNDETGFKILSRIIFIKNNKTFDELMLKIKANLHEKNMEIGHQRFKEALFETAASSFAVALGFKETELVQRWIEVCGELKKVKLLLNSNKKKDLGQYFDPDSLLNDPNKYEILEGVLNLSEFYLEKFDFKKGSYLYKRVGKFQFTKFNKSIEELKKKEKELKKKAKAARKKKGV